MRYGKLKNRRIQGIYEHYRRAKRLAQLANRCKNNTLKFRNLIAAVYPACAIVELMLEAAEKQELKPFRNKNIKDSRAKFEAKIIPMVPYYYLLEKIRIHDFHRFGCLPPSGKHQGIFYGGPVKLSSLNNGTVTISLIPTGPQFVKRGNSSIVGNRPLCQSNGLFLDEDSGQFVSLDTILNSFLKAVPEVLKEFKNYLIN